MSGTPDNSGHRARLRQRLFEGGPDALLDHELVELYEDRAKAYATSELFVGHPFAFHVRYYWQGKIDYVVVNPEVDADWVAQVTDAPKFDPTLLASSLRQRVQGAVLRLIQKIARGRRREVDLKELLRCPACERRTWCSIGFHS